MQTIFTAKCINGNQAVDTCITKNCLNSSYICGFVDCRCDRMHLKCQRGVFENIVKSVLKRNRTGLKCIESFLEFCDHGIKQFQILKDYVTNAGDEEVLFMDVNEREFIQAFKNDALNEFSGGFMFKLMQNLENASKSRESMRSAEYNIGLEIRSQSQALKKLVENIVGLIKKPYCPTLSKIASVSQSIPPVDFKFSKALKCKIISFDDHNTITLPHEQSRVRSKDQFFHYALLEPALDQIPQHQVKIRFLVHQKYSLRIGVSSKQYIESKEFRCELDDEKQGDVISEKGVICSHYLKYPEFDGFRNGDVVELVYNKQRQELRVRNVTRNEQAVLNVARRNGELLHFSVGMRNKEDKGSPVIQCLE